jgi:hypothetical protein
MFRGLGSELLKHTLLPFTHSSSLHADIISSPFFLRLFLIPPELLTGGAAKEPSAASRSLGDWMDGWSRAQNPDQDGKQASSAECKVQVQQSNPAHAMAGGGVDRG